MQVLTSRQLKKTFANRLQKPGAINLIINGINISKIKSKINNVVTRSEKILEKNSSAPNFDFFKIPAITGIKAEFIEPSANNLLNKFGSLNDIKKASDTKPSTDNFCN